MSDTVQDEKELNVPPMTAEEVAAHKKRMEEFYDENIPLLRKQAEYESLISSIDESRARGMEMRLRLAQMMTQTSKQQPPAPGGEPNTRKLKTD